jgi:hypothetical protein
MIVRILPALSRSCCRFRRGVGEGAARGDACRRARDRSGLDDPDHRQHPWRADYDTLFGNDGDQKPQPQMVGKYEISPTG